MCITKPEVWGLKEVDIEKAGRSNGGCYENVLWECIMGNVESSIFGYLSLCCFDFDDTFLKVVSCESSNFMQYKIAGVLPLNSEIMHQRMQFQQHAAFLKHPCPFNIIF